MIHKAN